MRAIAGDADRLRDDVKRCTGRDARKTDAPFQTGAAVVSLAAEDWATPIIQRACLCEAPTFGGSIAASPPVTALDGRR